MNQPKIVTVKSISDIICIKFPIVGDENRKDKMMLQYKVIKLANSDHEWLR